MIKPNELRIGNLINYTGNSGGYDQRGICTIKSIGETSCNEWQDMGASGGLEYEKMFGIPLTEGWLMSFGFEQIDDCNYFDLPDASFLLYFLPSLGVRYQFDGSFITDDIPFVHQLQNLYFALTGNELMIKS